MILSAKTKFNTLGYSYKVVGGATIQQFTWKHSTKRDKQLQQFVSARYQAIVIKSTGKNWTQTLTLVKNSCGSLVDFFNNVGGAGGGWGI